MSRTRDILKEYGYKPKKSKGQNFIVLESVLHDIVNAADIEADEHVLEIGPGPGNMTKYLAKKAKSVTAIEVDSELASVLKAENKDDNVEIIEGDALLIDFEKLLEGRGKVKVVANLPYNISTPVLFKLIENPGLFSELYLLLQKEVAQRISAPAGKKPYGILSVQLQLFADCEIVMNVGPESFSPKPKVDSALIKMVMLEKPRAQVNDISMFKKIVRASFAKRRKTIRNSLKSSGFGYMMEQVMEVMEELGIDPGRRAETLTVKEYADFANGLSKRG